MDNVTIGSTVSKNCENYIWFRTMVIWALTLILFFIKVQVDKNFEKKIDEWTEAINEK